MSLLEISTNKQVMQLNEAEKIGEIIGFHQGKISTLEGEKTAIKTKAAVCGTFATLGLFFGVVIVAASALLGSVVLAPVGALVLWVAIILIIMMIVGLCKDRKIANEKIEDAENQIEEMQRKMLLIAKETLTKSFQESTIEDMKRSRAPSFAGTTDHPLPKPAVNRAATQLTIQTMRPPGIGTIPPQLPPRKSGKPVDKPPLSECYPNISLRNTFWRPMEKPKTLELK